MCLKFTLGVRAWRAWVKTQSNAGGGRGKGPLFRLTADELSLSLNLFLKEARKPGGEEFTPDALYYLTLGIQQYLYLNGRVDNIFADPLYDKFTDQLDSLADKFSQEAKEKQYVETRVLEEHLWETRQLGPHSPFALLCTLLYYNTKYFNLTTVDEHMQLSFSHIMKNWKRSGGGSGAQPGGGGANKSSSRNVLLRFYPPQSSVVGTDSSNPGDAGSTVKKRKVYEQQENEAEPTKCPVKLYEFYLSKCPESVKSRNDVFYLLPERSCVPESPVWYSTAALPRQPLSKMLNRIKMVKEINEAILNDDKQ